MKRLLFILMSLLLCNVYASVADSTSTESEKKANAIPVKEKQTQEPQSPLIQNSDTCSSAHMQCFKCETGFKCTNLEYWIVLSPIIFFLVFLYCLRRHLHSCGFKLSDALTENTPVDLVKPNPDSVAASTMPTIPTKELPKSTSRLIVFISGFTAISIGVCFTSYYMYIFFATGCAPNLENLTNILLSLGIGVVPYVFN